MHQSQSASGPKVMNPLKPAIRWTLMLAGAVVIVMLVALVFFTSTTKELVLILGGAFLGAALVCLAVFSLYGRTYTRNIRRILSGEYWVHWCYTPDEGRRFVRHEVARARRRVQLTFLIGLPISALAGLGLGVLSGVTLGGLVVTGALLLMMLLIVLMFYLQGKGRASLWQGGQVEVYIHPKGIVYQSGKFEPFSGFNQSLIGVQIEPGDPPVLRFTTCTGTGRGYMEIDVRLPIPGGREAEARDLIERFRREVFNQF